jgi:hypothetical protein
MSTRDALLEAMHLPADSAGATSAASAALLTPGAAAMPYREDHQQQLEWVAQDSHPAGSAAVRRRRATRLAAAAS